MPDGQEARAVKEGYIGWSYPNLKDFPRNQNQIGLKVRTAKLEFYGFDSS